MPAAHILSNGAVVYANCGPTRRALLEERLSQIGLAEFTPPPRTDSVALKIALADYNEQQLKQLKSQRKASGTDDGEKFRRDKIIQPKINQKVNGFEVVDVNRREAASNDYVTDFSAKAVEGKVQITRGHADTGWIQGQFDFHKSLLGGGTVGSALIEVIAHLKGTTLREAGGVYWIPEESVAIWEQVTNAFESAGKETKVYTIRTVLDADTVRAVRDAIVSEVMDASTRLTEELTAGGLGEVAIANRKQRALSLHGRVREYEQILGEALADLHNVIAVAEQAASSAISVQQDSSTFGEMYATV